MITNYTGVELELYAEAMRVIPAIAAARVREDDTGVFTLHDDFQAMATELGVPASTAWSILATAGTVTVQCLVTLVADLEDVDQADVTERMIQAALDQAVARDY